MQISACGRYCDECKTYNVDCKGCYHTRKEKLMVHEDNMCPIYECVMDKYENRICSSCQKLPCDNFFKCIDPEFTDDENKKGIEARVNILKSMSL
jgi:hypothetical protein